MIDVDEQRAAGSLREITRHFGVRNVVAIADRPQALVERVTARAEIPGRTRQDHAAAAIDEGVRAAAERHRAGQPAEVLDGLVAAAAQHGGTVELVETADVAAIRQRVRRAVDEVDGRAALGAAAHGAARDRDVDRAGAHVALAVRANAVGVRTSRIDVACDVDGHDAAVAIRRVALREDAVRRVAQHDDVALLRDRDRTGVAVAADAAGEVLLLQDRDVLVAEAAGEPAAATDALREDAERVAAAREDVHGVRDGDDSAIAAAAAVATERETDAHVERRNRADPVLEAAIDVAGNTAAATDALREDRVCVVTFGNQVAADVVHGDVAAIAARAAAAADAELALQARVG